eukprot:scaffold35665_cov51-Phaeocystis_antarctica.AAC.2
MAAAGRGWPAEARHGACSGGAWSSAGESHGACSSAGSAAVPGEPWSERHQRPRARPTALGQRTAGLAHPARCTRAGRGFYRRRFGTRESL